MDTKVKIFLFGVIGVYLVCTYVVSAWKYFQAKKFHWTILLDLILDGVILFLYVLLFSNCIGV